MSDAFETVLGSELREGDVVLRPVEHREYRGDPQERYAVVRSPVLLRMPERGHGFTVFPEFHYPRLVKPTEPNPREELTQAIEALASLRGSVADGTEWVDRADVLQLAMRAANALKRMAEERRDQAVQEREIAQAKARIAEPERLVNKLEKSDG